MAKLSARVKRLEAQRQSPRQQRIQEIHAVVDAAVRCAAFSTDDLKLRAYMAPDGRPPTDEERALAARLPDVAPEFVAKMRQVYGPLAGHSAIVSETRVRFAGRTPGIARTR